ncbi:MAG: HPr(Ser) kinase/phosphatase [bacterium]
MPTAGPVSLLKLLKEEKLRLNLENLSREDLTDKKVNSSSVQVVGLSIAGFTRHLYRERIQLFGKSEADYLNTLNEFERIERTDTFLKEKPVCIIFTHPIKPFKYFLKMAEKYNIPILSSKINSSRLIDYIKDFLIRELAVYTTLHAQLVDVLGVGMLIMGDSGVGKSETSLDLVLKGHKLIADDIVEIKLIPPDHLVGMSNELMRNLVEIRGIGLVDLQRMYGVTSVLMEKEIDTVVRLVLWEDRSTFEYERIGSSTQYYEIMGTRKPYYVIPVRHGSNLSSIMEAVARDHLLKKQGINPAEEFGENLKKHLIEKANKRS